MEIDIEIRPKLAALEKDLEELGMTISDYKPKMKFELNKTASCALSTLYVIERATLSSNIFIERLKVNDNLNSLSQGFHYSKVYVKT